MANENNGHRSRLDEKIRTHGLDSLKVHEQLEYILFAVVPRGDTNAIAHRLLDKFGTILGVFNAEADDLIEVEGVGKRTAMFLSTMPQILGVVQKNYLENKAPFLDTEEKIRKYVTTFFYGKLVESAYLINLSRSRQLLSVIKISEGIDNETEMYTVKALNIALRNKASAVIVVHNHPCGTCRASISDVKTTARLKQSFEMLNIDFVDSLIVAGDKCESVDTKILLG